MVLGVLPQAQAIFAADSSKADTGSEAGFVPFFGSIIAQEGEQNGFYRHVLGKIPSAAPFLTGGSPVFAFTALQSFVVEGTCDEDIKSIGLPILGKLEVVTKKIDPKTAELEFAIPNKEGENLSESDYAIVYLSGQNLPVTVPISDVKASEDGHKGETRFKAGFPFETANFAGGLTIAALVKGTGSFENAAAVSEAAVNGPGLIEVN